VSDTPSSPKEPALRWLRTRAFAIADGLLFGGLVWILGSAAKAASGAVRLAFIMLTVAAFFAAISLGGWLLRRWLNPPEGPFETIRAWGYFRGAFWILLLSTMWFFILLNWLELSDSEINWLLAGGLAGVVVTWFCWLAWMTLAAHFPHRFYKPESPPRWWFRGTGVVAFVIGGTLGLALAAA
jgi:hypothetical protein